MTIYNKIFKSKSKGICSFFSHTQDKIREESGFSLKGLMIFILLVAGLTFLTIHLIRPSYCSGRFKTAINGIAVDSFSKKDKEIQEEILTHAKELGIVIDAEDVSIQWGPRQESLEIKLAYSLPVDLGFYNYTRQFNYTLRKKLSYPQKRINQTDQRLQGSYNKMLDKARKAEEKLKDYE